MHYNKKNTLALITSYDHSFLLKYKPLLPVATNNKSLMRISVFHEYNLNQLMTYKESRASVFHRFPSAKKSPKNCQTSISKLFQSKKNHTEDGVLEEACGTECPEMPLTLIPETSEAKFKSRYKPINRAQKAVRLPITKVQASNRSYSSIQKTRQEEVVKMPPIIKIKRVQATNYYPTSINPINLHKQEKIFFNSNCTVNPIFEYENNYAAERMLETYKVPKSDLLGIAVSIMDKLLKDYGSESNFLEKTGGPLLTLKETQEIFTEYIYSLGLENNITLTFAENTVSPTTILHNGNKGKSIIIIGLPIEYRKNRIQGVLDHEIGTHFLRKYNDNLQVWSSCRRKYDLRAYMTTEEGFAVLNQLVSTVIQGRDPYLFKAALNYYSAYKAHYISFAELYKDLEKYIDSPKRRFRACLRVKRGVVYTGRPGGLYKDQIYLEGAVKILRKRKEIDFKLLYAGKIALDDVERMQKKTRTNDLKYPWYLQDTQTYLNALDRIAAFNNI
jgi:hypothetical protein